MYLDTDAVMRVVRAASLSCKAASVPTLMFAADDVPADEMTVQKPWPCGSGSQLLGTLKAYSAAYTGAERRMSDSEAEKDAYSGISRDRLVTVSG